MDFVLNPIEVRVLGSLLEKDLATPEYYPLSLNALVNACNQKSNRDPVVSYDEQIVSEALATLRAKRLAFVRTGDSRVAKYGHDLGERFNLGRRELAALCVLLLRGPQTLGELRERTQRMYSFDDAEAVAATLERLERREADPLVKIIPRQPGWKEVRYMHLLAGDHPDFEPAPAAAPPQPDRFARLETEIEALRGELAELREQFAVFRRQFE